MYSYMYEAGIKLDQAAIKSANKSSRYDAGTVRARNAKRHLKRFEVRFPIHGELTIEQVSYLVLRQAQWAGLITTAYNDIIRRRASGEPGMFINSSMRKSTERELRIYVSWHDKMDRFLDNTQKRLEVMASAAAKRRLEKSA